MIDELCAKLRMHYPFSGPLRMGPGIKPAVLVIDFIRGFTDAESPIGGSWDREVQVAADLLRIAHAKEVPVIFTTVEYSDQEVSSILLSKKTPGISCLEKGSKWTEIDPSLPVGKGDLIIRKKYSSAFFATDLTMRLIARHVDTLLICGCVTSGCVRASAVDGAQYGFRPLVVREAVGDRSRLAHEANLLDIDLRYGDVISLKEAIGYLSNLNLE